MDKSHITFEELPQAVSELFAELEEIKRLLGNLQPPAPARRPIPVEEACRIVGKARQTVYALARNGKIPCYRRGRKLYFFEDELIGWIAGGRRSTLGEIRAEAQSFLYDKYGRRIRP